MAAVRMQLKRIGQVQTVIARFRDADKRQHCYTEWLLTGCGYNFP